MQDEERIAYLDGKIEAYDMVVGSILNRHLTPGNKLNLLFEVTQALTQYRAGGPRFFTDGFKEVLQDIRAKLD